VLINTISKILFVLKASKHIIIDPAKYEGPIYASIASRFQIPSNERKAFDFIPIVAIGCAEQVSILEARPSKHHEYLSFKRPISYYQRKSDSLQPMRASVPSLSWGCGHSPAIKDRSHSILAVAWGPLIQLIVLLDD